MNTVAQQRIRHIAQALILTLFLPTAHSTESRTHLFILSGQSNMERLDPAAHFTPALKAAFPNDRIIVVKDAHDGEPIRQWYKKWRDADGASTDDNGKLYDQLHQKVAAATKGELLTTTTFIWMQGERDAREKHGDVYAASLQGLIDQVRADVPESVVFSVVIGRISDFDLNNQRDPHWTRIRDAQMQVADSHPQYTWVDTDYLNGPHNGLHYSSFGYKRLGQYFARSAIELITDATRK